VKKNLIFRSFTLAAGLVISMLLCTPLYALKKGISDFNIKKISIYNGRWSHDYGVMFGALKYYNFGIHYHLSYQAFKAISFQGGIAVNNFYYNIYSTSDKHPLSIMWFPIIVGSRVNLISSRDKRHIINAYGKTGIAFAPSRESNNIKSEPFYEFGLGLSKKIKSGRSKLILDVGMQNYKLQGTLISSFQSTIDYNLNFRSYLIRISWRKIIS